MKIHLGFLFNRLFFEYVFQDRSDLRRRSVKKDAYAINSRRKDADANGRCDQNCNRDRYLIPHNGTHTNPRKHRHR